MDQAIIRGVVGEIRWAYYVAGKAEGWTAVRDPKGTRPRGAPAGWSLSARLVLTDPFKMSQRPLIFVVSHQKGRWVWPIESCRVAGDVLTARLGPVEEF